MRRFRNHMRIGPAFFGRPIVVGGVVVVVVCSLFCGGGVGVGVRGGLCPVLACELLQFEAL